jgi:hypothetical protein
MELVTHLQAIDVIVMSVNTSSRLATAHPYIFVYFRKVNFGFTYQHLPAFSLSYLTIYKLKTR